MKTLDELAADLLPGWSMWQAAMGQIVLQLRHDGHVENLDGATIREVLEKAADYKPLPRIRRCPEPVVPSEWEPRKDGKFWKPHHVPTGRPLECLLKTRKEFEAMIQRWSESVARDIADWREKFGEMFPNGATEGVDFRWQD